MASRKKKIKKSIGEKTKKLRGKIKHLENLIKGKTNANLDNRKKKKTNRKFRILAKYLKEINESPAQKVIRGIEEEKIRVEIAIKNPIVGGTTGQAFDEVCDDGETPNPIKE